MLWISLLSTNIHFLCDFKEFVYHFFALRIYVLSGSSLMNSLQLCHLGEGFIDFLLMLFSVSFQKFILFELCIDVSSFVFLFDLFCFDGFILNYNVFVLPSPPYLILDFLLLLGCLLNCCYYASFSTINFDHLVFLHLLHDHFSPPFLPLMLFLFILTIRQPTFLSCLCNWCFPLWPCFNHWLFRDLFFIRWGFFALSTF